MPNIRFAFSVVLVAVLLGSTSSCVIGPKPLPVDLTTPFPVVTDDSNLLIHNGMRIAAPPDWRFQLRTGAGTNGELFRVSAPDRSALEVYRIELPFSADPERLHEYMQTHMKEQGTIIQSGTLEGREYWRVDDSRNAAFVLLEGSGRSFLEWRISAPLNESGDPRIVLGIMLASRQTDPSISHRRTPAGFVFSSMGTTWRWAGDIGDGILMEKMVTPEGIQWLVGLFSPTSVPEAEQWRLEAATEATAIADATIHIAGSPCAGKVYLVRYNTRSARIILIPDEDAVNSLYLVAVVSGYQAGEWTIAEFLGDEDFRKLVNIQCMVPPQVLP